MDFYVVNARLDDTCIFAYYAAYLRIYACIRAQKQFFINNLYTLRIIAQPLTFTFRVLCIFRVCVCLFFSYFFSFMYFFLFRFVSFYLLAFKHWSFLMAFLFSLLLFSFISLRYFYVSFRYRYSQP